MAEKEITLLDLLSGGNLKAKLLAVLPDILSNTKKEALLQQISQGKAVKEFHTKAGRKNDPPKEFQKRECLNGHMALPSEGEWACFAIWSNEGKTYQGTFRMKPALDPSKTILSLQMSSPPGTPATSFTVIDVYFKIDTDGQNLEMNIAGELGVSYRDKKDQLRTIRFTTEANKVAGL